MTKKLFPVYWRKMASKVNGAPIAVVEENHDNKADNLNLSDDEDEVEENIPQITGSLNKWTNYIHGWQTRYFILRDGTLAYYKSENDTAFGCRGAVTISRAVVQPHDFDECRFDVSVNDSVWYLRAEDADERQKWIEALETYKHILNVFYAESGYGSQNDLRRHGSVISLTSNKSLTSSSSFKKGRGLKEKLAELETFRDIVSKQIETLQTYFDACAENIPANVLDRTLDAEDLDDVDHLHCVTFGSLSANKDDDKKIQNGLVHSPMSLDFKGEALTFKATTAGILTTLQHCIDLVGTREEAWKKRLEKEIDKRRKTEDQCKQALGSVKNQQQRQSVGPDYEEGPHSALNEDEWHDAVDAALERQDIEDRRVSRLLSKEAGPIVKQVDKILLSKSHPLFEEIDRMTVEQVKYAKAGVEEGFWQLFAEDGEMKMFKREVEIDGLVCDPLKAVHSVKGITAHEYLHFFFESDYKMDWDTSLEEMRVVERMSDDSCVIQQVHKRVWPATQRESLFWSHFRRMPSMRDANAADLLVVCNHDTPHKDVPVNNKFVRVGLTVAMVCQTVIDPPKPGVAISRDDLTCKIIYVAQINPGGWAPSTVLRAVYKREYPKFLKRFTQYVMQKVEGTQIRF